MHSMLQCVQVAVVHLIFLHQHPLPTYCRKVPLHVFQLGIGVASQGSKVILQRRQIVGIDLGPIHHVQSADRSLISDDDICVM